MTISRAQMYRQLYQVGGMSGMGIESLSPMQPAMQPAMQSAMYSPLQNNYSGMPMMANGGRIGYQGGGSIEEARNFFINQQGLNPDQADMIVSQGLQTYNQQIQPQTMMQMASGGIARLGYGFGNFVKGSGVAQPVSGGDTSGGGFGGMGLMGKLIRQNPQMFRQASNQQRLLNASSLNKDFIDLNENGIDDREEAAQGGRIGYQMGGEADMAQMGGMEMPQMQGMDPQQALQTIIQILIENGIPPEQALELASQIIQIFAQGGAPAVEAFADQLEQQEQMEAMAGGGIAGYGYRQGYGFGGIGKIFSGAAKAVSGVVKGVAKAVKSVAKSPIGRAALTIGAATFLGPGAFGIQGLGLSGLQLGLATAASNLGLQAIGGQKLNFLEAGLSGLSAGLQNPGLSGDPSTISQGGLTDAQLFDAGQTSNFGNTVNVPLNQIQPVDIPADIGSYAENVQNITNQGITAKEFTSPLGTISDYQGIQQGSPLSMSGPTVPKPEYFESVKAVAKDPSLSGIKYLATEGLSNIGTGISEFVQKNPKTALAGAFATGLGSGIAFGAPQQEGESNEDFARRQEEESNLSLTQFGRNLQIRNPFFYARYGAVNPFAEQAAQGGIMGYAAGGSMIPPARRIEGGVIELDARKTGGYIPYGKKERVDDVPAMLAKDEFVFTSRAVKGAGGGSARRGAAKMYKLMKQLEAKGKKMERQGARA